MPLINHRANREWPSVGDRPESPLSIADAAPWQQRAACAQKTDDDGRPIDARWWFPTRDESEPVFTREAKRICAGCPVRMECLTWITSRSEYGTWAGLTESDRRELKIGKRLP